MVKSTLFPCLTSKNHQNRSPAPAPLQLRWKSQRGTSWLSGNSWSGVETIVGLVFLKKTPGKEWKPCIFPWLVSLIGRNPVTFPNISNSWTCWVSLPLPRSNLGDIGQVGSQIGSRFTLRSSKIAMGNHLINGGFWLGKSSTQPPKMCGISV